MFRRRRDRTRPTLQSVNSDGATTPPDLAAAVLWAGARPWVVAALENTKFAQAEIRGSKEAKRVRILLGRALDELPRLPEFDLPLAYTVGDDIRVEVSLKSEHPAYIAAEGQRAAFAAPEKQLLVERAFNWVSVLPQHGFNLKRRLVNKRPTRQGLPPRVRSEILHRDNYTCQYCGRKPPQVVLEVDHRVPVSAGGADVASNLVTACVDCNRGKSNRFST